MPRKRKITMAALALAAAVAIGGGIYAVSAFTGQSTAEALAQTTVANTSTTTATLKPQPLTPTQAPELRTQILGMLKNHMGLTGSDAEKLATTMFSLMQKNGNVNIASMLRRCDAVGDQMMQRGAGQSDNIMGSAGMMGIASSSTIAPSSSSAPGMMGGHASHHAGGGAASTT